VAILATAAGWAVQYFAGIPYAMLIGLFVGIFGARLVPGTSCATPQDSDSARSN
ncbi:MAG: hypothetical protein ACI8UD_003024, partial [Planctomycetota bacterium]